MAAPERPRPWLAAGFLCAITLLAWANSFQSGFVFDNNALLLGDSRIQKATLGNLALIVNHTYWWPRESGLYRPLTTLTYLFNYAILGNGDHPAGYHWINLLLHTGNVLLVFALARRLVKDLWQSFFIAAVWAVHPVLTESVTNIVGRADLLAGMATLGGLLIYLKSTEAGGWRRPAWLMGLMAVTAAGVFSKESAVVIVGIVALYEATWWNPRRLRGFLLGCLAMCPAVIAMLWMRSRVLAASAPARFPFQDNPIAGADFLSGRLTAVKVMAKYLGLLVWPAHLSVDYSYAQIPLADGRPTDWVAWFVVAAVAIGVVFLYRRNKPAFFAAVFAFLTLLPASNLLFPMGTIMAERLLYLPAIGLSICLTLALFWAGRRTHLKVLAPVALCLITAGFGARTWARNADWRDDSTLWAAAVRTSPLSFKTHAGLAHALYEEHDLDGAIAEDERSLAILDSLPDQRNSAPTYMLAGAQHVEKAYTLRRRDDDGRMVATPESVAEFQKARAILIRAVSIVAAQHKAEREETYGLLGKTGDPKWINTDVDLNAYFMLSEAEQRLGDAEDSIQSARKAQETAPLRSEPYERIHDALFAAGRKDEALAALMEGMLLTSGPGLQRKLVEDYGGRPDGKECAISYAKLAPEVDFSCATVRHLACSVSPDAIRVALKAGGPEVAARLRNEWAAKYGCS
jgi:tetratricopeptide (TPR) repeat protein